MEQNGKKELDAVRSNATLYNEDARQLITHLQQEYTKDPSNLVDTTITSPPYGDLKDYGYDPDTQIGLSDTYEEYLEDLKTVFSQLYDITKETGTLWVVVNTFKKQGEMFELPFDIASICQNLGEREFCPSCRQDGTKVPLVESYESSAYCHNCESAFDSNDDSWMLQDIVIWDKQRALPYSGKGRFRNVFEYILCFSKSQDYHFDLDKIRIANPEEFKDWWVSYPERYSPRGIQPKNIWSMCTPSQGAFSDGTLDHPAPFPQELVERIVRLTTNQGDVVFDPFAGTGTVLAQSALMNRTALGFELSEEYCNSFDDILEYWSKQRTKTNATNGSVERQQTELERLIAGLRQTRHARELLRKMAATEGVDRPSDLDIDFLLQHSKKVENSHENPSSFITSDLTLVSGSDNPTELSERAEAVLSTSPCSDFGIQSGVTVVEPQRVRTTPGRVVGWHADYGYLYRNGTHNEYARTIPLKELPTLLDAGTEYRDDRYPPIISDIGLQVPDPQHQDTVVGTMEFRMEEAESSSPVQIHADYSVNAD